MHLAKHSLMAADLHKNCVSIHCAPIKVNCNLFIISLNLIYCEMNSIYRLSNGCANHSSSHWTGLCFFLRQSSSYLRDQSTFLNFLKRWPCALHPAQAQVALCRWLRPASLVSLCPAHSPCNPLPPTHALWRKLAPRIPSGFLPWTALLPDILTHPRSQGQRLPRQQPPGHRVFSLGQYKDSSPHLTLWTFISSFPKIPPPGSIFRNFIFLLQ